jgi:hypothetical protein
VKTHGFEGVMEGNLIYGNSEVCHRCAHISVTTSITTECRYIADLSIAALAMLLL